MDRQIIFEPHVQAELILVTYLYRACFYELMFLIVFSIFF